MNEQELAELKRRVDANDPNAMYLYAELVRATDPREADKFTILAAQLGNPQAAEKIGDKYLADGDVETAAHYFKTGANAGISDCAVKLAVIDMANNETAAVRELENLAEMGVSSACVALASYYKSQGNRRESAFWRSLVK